jgi:hypothetical protein
MANVINYDPNQSALAPSGKDLRGGLQAIIQEAAPKARVEIRWLLRPNLAECAALLLSDKDQIDNKPIPHLWIGTILADQAFMESKHSVVIPCQVSLFGFILFSSGILRDGLTSEDILDAERREIQRRIACNISFLAMDNPAGIHGVTIPQFGNSDVVYFGGFDCNAVEGLMDVRLREQYITV